MEIFKTMCGIYVYICILYSALGIYWALEENYQFIGLIVAIAHSWLGIFPAMYTSRYAWANQNT